MKIFWSKQAISDLAAVRDYLEAHYPIGAKIVVARIEGAIERLGVYPAMGRTGRREGTRELVVTQTPFVVVYRPHEGYIEILSLLHGAQAW
ncbi:type II toxin-antitoxin system RelE/ParE family toxin [Gloeobacter violaceus]|uniref:Gsr3528 protein n=1 Tax=Gloeobacter violaceus (strain ATCC 29082 / PCC 7421) TaxID=251221 RepID=Q7NFJ7_GLOVI|nr:type II toxin-antitoxin system RelE/ParE family toxin [Gloeobacter violaceus]BAC91469.1 gsr3528 [Gloeobacter violaceus PCC 7421]